MISVGTRIRLLEPPETTAWWRLNSPGEWFPTYGMTGTIMEIPAAFDEHGHMLVGGGPTVRWDNGRVSYLGSGSLYEVIR